jgi:formate dehydrogenase subunit beta
MPKNMAILVAELIQEYPQNRVGVVMRPCELRALIEQHKHRPLNLERVFLIGMECLGTFPQEDYNWRAERKDGAINLTYEILKFARQGGIAETRYRLACQMCDSPSPHSGHIHISFVGLPVHDYLLISTENAALSRRLKLEEITDGPAGPEAVSQNQKMIDQTILTRRGVRGRVTEALDESLPRDVKTLVRWMENCGACQQCLEVCPICSVSMPQKMEYAQYEPWSVIRWLVSCADCGMCEQACPNNLPLVAIFGNIRRELARAYGYKPGFSFADPLPI